MLEKFKKLNDILFGSPGKKIKILGTVLFWILAVASVVSAILLIVAEVEFHIALIALLGGLLAAWIIALFINGFGELIDKGRAVDFELDPVCVTDETGEKEFACPVCGEDIDCGQKYCDACGQEIDWED